MRFSKNDFELDDFYKPIKKVNDNQINKKLRNDST